MITRLRGFRRDTYMRGGLRLTSLPDTEQEAMRVASLFAPPERHAEPTKAFPDGTAVVCTNRGACEDQVKRWLGGSAGQPQFRYLLFSMHGLADPQNGMLSCVALSAPGAQSVEDGFLQAQEVLGLKLDVDLVMLSACQTGLGRLRGGEGLVGLSTAFFVAGAESVCASMWQVPGGPTGQLVTEFFKHLREDKVDKAEALRQAQLAVMRQGRVPGNGWGSHETGTGASCRTAAITFHLERRQRGGREGRPVHRQGAEQPANNRREDTPCKAGHECRRSGPHPGRAVQSQETPHGLPGADLQGGKPVPLDLFP
jgi:hypothetical protein